MKRNGLGIRTLFRAAILFFVVLADIAFMAVSHMNVTSRELARAEKSIGTEVNYLCLQLESLGERADLFTEIMRSEGIDPQALKPGDMQGYQLLSSPIGDVLKGYTLAETGTVFLVADGAIIASDDARVPVGSDVRELLGDEVLVAIDASIQSKELQNVPFRGVFDEPGGEGAFGDRDDEAYLLAGRQGDHTVVVIEPTSMVFRDRREVMARETAASLVILIVLGFIVDRLLDLAVARRIDKTNEALERITSGELDTRVEEMGTREFMSLASGINVTVEALQGWIAEAASRLDSELAAARAIQESALPRTFPPFPDVPKFDIFALMDPAREVGGDFYDFFLIGESDANAGKLVFLIADVAGKGVPAALFMMKAATHVRSELQGGTELGQAVENVSMELAEGNDSCMFVTMWVGVLDYGTWHLDYVNAGHNPPLHWQEGIGWRWLRDRSGLPLGLGVGGSYRVRSLECRPGDTILLYTDGVSEAMSVEGKQYGEDRLAVVANANSTAHPEELVREVRSDVGAFAQGAEQSDDITILALELGTPAERETPSE